MTKIVAYTETTITVRVYKRERIETRFECTYLCDGRGIGRIRDRVTGEHVGEVVGVHTETEAVEAYTAERAGRR